MNGDDHNAEAPNTEAPNTEAPNTEAHAPDYQPSRAPYTDVDLIRVCLDHDMWGMWVWDGTRRDGHGHPLMEEVDGDGDTWCAEYVTESYGPVAWFRLEPAGAPV